VGAAVKIKDYIEAADPPARTRNVPRTKARPGNAGRKRVIDWERAELLYTSSLNMTYKEVAEEIGAYEDTISARGRKDGWPAKREANRAKLVQEGLQQALTNQRKGIAALTTLEYQEAIAILTMLQAARRSAVSTGPDGKTLVSWSPAQIRTYARAVRETADLARRPLGLPTEILATPEQAARPDVLSALPTEDLEVLRRIASKTRGLPDPEK